MTETALAEPQTVADLLAVAEETGELVAYTERGLSWRFLFENAWVLSIGFGPNYAADFQGAWLGQSINDIMRRVTDFANGLPDADAERWMTSTTAEVMVIRPDGNRMVWPDNEDGILAFEPVASVAALIRMVAKEGMTP